MKYANITVPKPFKSGGSGSEAFAQVLRSQWLLIAPALALLAVAMVYPLAKVVFSSFSQPEVGYHNYVWFFSTPVNLAVLQRTFTVAACVTLVCLVCSYPYAYLMTAVGPRTRLLLLMCVLVPFWVSGVIRTFAWIIILQDSGLINKALGMVGLGPVRLIRTPLGVAIGMIQVLLPFAIMPLYAVMRGIDLRLIQAAQSLGATPACSFVQIYLPLSLPGVFGAGTLVFILALGFYITPVLLGGPSSSMISNLIQQQILSLLNWGTGGAMGVILLVSTFGFLALVSPIMRKRYQTTGGSR